MVVEVYKLTDELKEKLAQIPDECREKGPPDNPNDPTRLCNKWRGALKEDKEMFNTLMNSNPKQTVKLLQANHTCFRIYTKDAVQSAVGNWRRKYKKEVEARANSKFNIIAWHLFVWLTYLT